MRTAGLTQDDLKNRAHMLADTPSQVREQVKARLQDAWVRPATPPAGFRVPAERVDGLAKATLDAMLVRAFRVTPFPPADEYEQILGRVRHWVARGKPVRVMIGYAPMKNPRVVDYTQADWAEFFALGNLAAWHNKVSGVYPPGLRIKIVFDDSTIRM